MYVYRHYLYEDEGPDEFLTAGGQWDSDETLAVELPEDVAKLLAKSLNQLNHSKSVLNEYEINFNYTVALPGNLLAKKAQLTHREAELAQLAEELEAKETRLYRLQYFLEEVVKHATAQLRHCDEEHG